jgi:hypothetical protein
MAEAGKDDEFTLTPGLEMGHQWLAASCGCFVRFMEALVRAAAVPELSNMRRRIDLQPAPGAGLKAIASLLHSTQPGGTLLAACFFVHVPQPVRRSEKQVQQRGSAFGDLQVLFMPFVIGMIIAPNVMVSLSHWNPRVMGYASHWNPRSNRNGQITACRNWIADPRAISKPSAWW